MQEVKEICDGMLAEPPPPMTSPDDLLRSARRSRARHRAWLAVGFAAAATLAATAAVPLLAKPPGQAPDVVAAAPSSAAAPKPLPVQVADLLPEGDTFATTAQTGQVWFLRGLDDVPMPLGDLCQADYPLRFKVRVEPGSCEVITVGGVQVRTGTYRIAQSGNTAAYDVSFAIRYKDNRAIIALHVPKVAWESGQASEPILTRRQLAEMLVPASG